MDVAFVRLPLSTSGLQWIPLFTEPRVAAMSTAYPLAIQETVTLDDLRDEPLIAVTTTDPAWNDFWLAMDSREETDRPPVIGEVESLEEELTLLSTGRALSITVSAASRHFSRPGIAFRRIVDIPGSTLSVAWRADAETPIVRRFVEIAVAVRDRETALVDWVSAGGG